jgi:hypothetical protein
MTQASPEITRFDIRISGHLAVVARDTRQVEPLGPITASAVSGREDLRTSANDSSAASVTGEDAVGGMCGSS